MIAFTRVSLCFALTLATSPCFFFLFPFFLTFLSFRIPVRFSAYATQGGPCLLTWLALSASDTFALGNAQNLSTNVRIAHSLGCSSRANQGSTLTKGQGVHLYLTRTERRE